MLSETFTTNREKSQITILQSNSFVADAHRGDGKRFIVRADEKLSAFVAEQRGVLEQAEQFEHDHDNDIKTVTNRWPVRTP